MQLSFGDQSLLSWIVFGLYFLVIYLIWIATKMVNYQERGFLLINLVVLLALGLNKQLDIQTDFINLAKHLAHNTGFYSYKSLLKLLFVVMVGIVTVATMYLFFFLFRRLFIQYKVLCLGWTCLFIFIVLRIAFFEHIGLWNFELWRYQQYFQVLELVGLVFIAIGIKRS